MEIIHGKLDNIYDWFQANLKNRGDKEASQSRRPVSEAENTPEISPNNRPSLRSEVTFSLHCQGLPRASPTNASLICPRATFNPSLIDRDEISGNVASLPPLFCCLCRPSGGIFAGERGAHADEVNLNGTSPLCA